MSEKKKDEKDPTPYRPKDEPDAPEQDGPGEGEGGSGGPAPRGGTHDPKDPGDDDGNG